MKHAATRTLFAYWNDLRGERAAPERSEIDPTAIRDILADTFMLDVDMEGRFPFRLAGTRVNALFDAEQKGRSFLDLWRREERRNLAAILMTVSDSASPVVAGGIASSSDQQECGLELLFLPLRHHGKTHARILGLVKVAPKPAWLGLVPLQDFTLRSLRMIDAAERDLQRPVPRIAVGQRMTLPELVAARENAAPRKPHLRLIQGGL